MILRLIDKKINLFRGFDGNEDKGREVICAGKNSGRGFVDYSGASSIISIDDRFVS